MHRLLLSFAFLALSASVFAADTPTPADAHLKELSVVDLQVGTGAEAATGMRVKMNYAGWLYDPDAADKHGKPIDSSPPGHPLSFRLGDRGIIKGWNQGVVGMRVGGKRELLIPAELGYGNRGAGDGVIPPRASLVFDIELLDAK
jgi:FKBP-type peptidyl-prolyl cis-trans isomerase FkpA